MNNFLFYNTSQIWDYGMHISVWDVYFASIFVTEYNFFSFPAITCWINLFYFYIFVLAIFFSREQEKAALEVRTEFSFLQRIPCSNFDLLRYKVAGIIFTEGRRCCLKTTSWGW